MDFLEKLSTLLGKQYLFKQDDGTYYNRYHNQYDTKEESEKFIFEILQQCLDEPQIWGGMRI